MERELKGPGQRIIYELPSILEFLRWAHLFPREQPLEIELGSGDGSFLVNYASAHPERNFVGVERLLGRIRKVERKAQRAKLTNVRGIRIESSYLLRYLVPEHSVSALHIYFPDPWPKRKHQRHRLINEDFPGLAARVLGPRGTVYLRTDDSNYFEQMQRVFSAETGFTAAETPGELASVHTDFEKDFSARGIHTLHSAYILA